MAVLRSTSFFKPNCSFCNIRIEIIVNQLHGDDRRFRALSDGGSEHFGDCAGFAMLIKFCRAVADGERKHSPAEAASVEADPVMGQPDPERICMPIIERSSLSLRMSVRRCTRLTNAFSKKRENHWAAMSLWYKFHNFCRIHKPLRVTPAMAARDYGLGLGRC